MNAAEIRVRRALTLILMVMVSASPAHAESPAFSVEIGGASRDQVNNELVLKMTRDARFRLTQESHFQITFEADADEGKNNNLYQTGRTIERFIYTVADTGHGVQIVANIALVENVGTPFEKRTQISSGADAQKVQSILEAIKSDLLLISKKSKTEATKSSPKRKDGSPPTALTTMAATQASVPPDKTTIPAPSDSPRLGFSGEPSKDGAPQGFVIIAVDPKTPADAAGLQPSDIVTAIDGRAVTTYQQMQTAQTRLKRKKFTRLKVIRGGKQFDATVRFR